MHEYTKGPDKSRSIAQSVDGTEAFCPEYGWLVMREVRRERAAWRDVTVFSR